MLWIEIALSGSYTAEQSELKFLWPKLETRQQKQDQRKLLSDGETENLPSLNREVAFPVFLRMKTLASPEKWKYIGNWPTANSSA